MLVRSFYWLEKQFIRIEAELGSYEAVKIAMKVNKDDPDSKKKGAKKIKTEDRPLVYHTDLKKYVINTIMMLKEKGMLQLSKPGIPPNTLEILWTGDKSDSTFLFSFQVLNVELPQSQLNTRCALMFEAPDSHENLKAALVEAKIGNFPWLSDLIKTNVPYTFFW